MKSVFVNVGVALIACVIAFGAAEITVRMLYEEDTVLFPRYQTGYTYGKYKIRGMKANVEFWHKSIDGRWKFTTNSKGFRNTQEFAYAKPTGVFRVLSLGDSNTQGYEVRQDETFSSVMERALAQPDRTAEVLNTGVSGFGTAEELAFLENEGVRYKPDAVVVGFFANDFDDNLKSGLFGLDADGRVVEKSYEHVPGVTVQNVIYAIPGVSWLSEHSYAYSVLFNQVWILAKLQLGKFAAKKAATTGEEATVIGGFEYTIPQRATHYQIDLAVALLERLHATCKTNGIRFIVVDIPAYPAPYRFQPSLTPPVLERLRALDIEVVSSQALFAPYDGVAEMNVLHGYHHISEFAHTLIGAEVAKRLREGATR